MIATAGVGLAMGAAKFFEGRAMQKKGEQFAENFDWQELQNPYENQQVSTLGSDLRTEQANIGAASATEALRTGGTRALVGGLGRVEAGRNIVNREEAVNLDEQQKVIDRAKAQQDVMNQQMIEKRQGDELAGYGQMMNVGMGMKNQGMSDVLSGVGALGQGLSGLGQQGLGEQQPPVEPVSSLQPVGTTYNNTPTARLPWSR